MQNSIAAQTAIGMRTGLSSLRSRKRSGWEPECGGGGGILPGTAREKIP